MDMLEPLDRLALIIAAFCHDIDHPGHNNAFEVGCVWDVAVLSAPCATAVVVVVVG
jgi:hypothetical protein